MGFKKSQALEHIRVPMTVKTASADGTALDEANVVHVFSIPTPEVREEYQRRLVKIKGKKVTQGSRSDASWFLWLHSVSSVEGYDDLPKVDKDGLWKQYFSDAIGRIHVDNAVDMLMEVLSAEETEQEKKSEPSLEASS